MLCCWRRQVTGQRSRLQPTPRDVSNTRLLQQMLVGQKIMNSEHWTAPYRYPLTSWLMSDVQSPGMYVIMTMLTIFLSKSFKPSILYLSIHSQIKSQHRTAQNCCNVTQLSLSCHFKLSHSFPTQNPHAWTRFWRHPTNRNGKSNGETDQDKQAEDVQVVAHLVENQNL